MVDSFFQSDKKRKRTRGGAGGGGARGGGSGPSRVPRVSKERVQAARDEELDSDGEGPTEDIEDMDFRAGRGPITLDDDEFVDANETAAEKRVRLARGYLDKVRKDMEEEQAEDDYDAAEIDRELIASRLKQEVDEAEGRIHRFYAAASPSSSRFKTSHQTPTGVAMTATGNVYLSTKNGNLLKFDRKTLKHTTVRSGEGSHQGPILCVAASEDDKWVVTGGQDKVVGVWDMSGEEPRWATGMRGHKDAVSSLTFPPLSNPSAHILSASMGRHLTLHSLSTLSALDTFFGHQDSITSVSALKPTAAVTAGSRDRTCRWWKVEEEVQLVLRSGDRSRDADREYYEGSVDVVCVLDDSHFVAGGDSGSIALYSTGKKKAIFKTPLAHGVDDDGRNLFSSKVTPTPRWITSIAAIRGTNIFASGSWDGRIRLWAMDEGLRSFKQVGEVPVEGVVNGLQILSLPEGVILTAAVAREPRLGRWLTLKQAKNGVLVAELQLATEAPEVEAEAEAEVEVEVEAN